MKSKSIQTKAIEKLAKVIYKSFAKCCADNNMHFNIDPNGESWIAFANCENLINWPRLYAGGPLVVKGENFQYSFLPEQALKVYKKFCQIDGVKPIKYDDPEIIDCLSQKIEYGCTATAVKKFMGKDPLHPEITGIYYAEGVAYATDTHKIIATPASYPESLEGKIADKSKRIINAKPLQYKHVFSGQESIYKKVQISKKHNYNYIAIGSAIIQATIAKSEYGKETRSCINICGAWFEVENIQALLDLSKTNEVVMHIGQNQTSTFSVYKKGVLTAVGAIAETSDQSMSIYRDCIAAVNYNEVQHRPLSLLESIQSKNEEQQQVEPTTELHNNTVEPTETAPSQKTEIDTTSDSQKADSDGDNINEPTAENGVPIEGKRGYYIPQRTIYRACCAILLLILLYLGHETASRLQYTNRHEKPPYIANLTRCAPSDDVGITYADVYQQSAQLRHVFGLCSATLAAPPQAATRLCRIYLVPYTSNRIAVMPTIKKRAYNSGFG